MHAIVDDAVLRRADRIARDIEAEVEEVVMLRALGSTIANVLAPMAGVRATSKTAKALRTAIEARPDLPDAVWTFVWLPPNRRGVPASVEISRVWTVGRRVRTFRITCVLSGADGILHDREEELMHYNPWLFPRAGKEAHLRRLLAGNHIYEWASLLVDGERLIERAKAEAEQAGYRLAAG